MLSKDEEIYLDPPEMDSIRQFLSTALNTKDNKSKNNKSKTLTGNYDQIVNQIQTRDDPEILWKVYIGLASFVSFFTSKPELYKDLIQAIYSYDFKLDKKVTIAFVNLLGQIVSSNATFLAPTFQFLVKLFLLDEGEVDIKTDINIYNDRILRIHKALQTVLELVPISINELYLAMEFNSPHKRFNQEVQAEYITHMLSIYDYVPTIQTKILELLISKCLEIDVEIVIEDSGDVKIIEEYTHEDDDLFQLDDEYNNTSFNNLNTSNISKRGMSFTEDISTIPTAVIESSDKLDAMLVRIITHIDILLKGNEDVQERLSQQLLIVFEDRILSTHKSKFVQFILFFSASRSDKFCKMYLQRLLKISLDDKNQSILKRQYAVGYLASFLSRANFLSFITVNDVLNELISWCSSYVDNNNVGVLNNNIIATAISTSANMNIHNTSPRGSLNKASNNDNDLSKHETFFTLIQACCYILCFYGTEFSMMQMASRHYWENSVTCSLNPLRYCLQSVKVEFLRLVSHIGLFREEVWGLFPQDILGKNNDMSNGKNIQFSSLKRSAIHRFGSGINPLDSFFPFDPCLLSRVHTYIENYYRLWKGVPGLDYDKDDKDDKDDDDELMVSSVASSVVSSLAYTYETSGIAMSIGGNSVPGESILRALSYQDSNNNKIVDQMKSTNSSDASWDGGDNDAGTESDSGLQQNQGSQNGSIWALPRRRPRQFSVGSADGW